MQRAMGGQGRDRRCPRWSLWGCLLAFYLPTAAWAADYRLDVAAEGLYRVGYADLGLAAPIPSTQMRLSNRGVPVAAAIEDGGDGLFGPGDTLHFYGQPVRAGDAEYKYTDENVYRLITGAGAGTAMTGWNATAVTTPATHFRDRQRFETNSYYWQSMPNGAGLDHWFWGNPISAGSGRDLGFTLAGVVGTGADARLTIALHGQTNILDNAGDHRTRVTLNAHVLGTIDWDGQTALQQVFDVPAAWLKESPDQNSLRVDELGSGGSGPDSIFLDWVEIEYERRLEAVADALAFDASGTGEQGFRVTGFTTDRINVYDVSDPGQVRRLLNPVVVADGAGYAVEFNATVDGDARFYVVAASAVRSGTPVLRPTSTDLRAGTHRVDYLVITHETLKAAAQSLAQYRSDGGYRVLTVTTGEIYDAFSDGIFTPLAIKAFLRHAFEHWQVAPRFVVLIGDANLDYKDYYGSGQINHVPAYLIETAGVGETPTDNWYVMLSSDSQGREDPFPDMAIGRIPAKSGLEVTRFVDKLIAYETGMVGRWRSNVLMASGDQDPRFLEYSDEWAGHVPVGYHPIRLNPADYPGERYQARGDFQATLSANGAAILTYFGHGTVGRWIAAEDDDASGGIRRTALELIASDDSASFSSFRSFPFIAAFNCLNGLFAKPFEGQTLTLAGGGTLKVEVPLPEALVLRAQSGAIAMWSPSAFAYPSEQRHIGNALFSGIFEGGERILGVATQDALVDAVMKEGVSEDNLFVFTFIGDPATHLAIAPDNATGSSGGGSGGGGGGAGDLWLLVLLGAALGRVRLGRGGRYRIGSGAGPHRFDA